MSVAAARVDLMNRILYRLIGAGFAVVGALVAALGAHYGLIAVIHSAAK